ncbi:hypothetical protein [Vibrio metschnikovii]|uniref:hypothetical protein n=1 Tax=Vibrio metschnikovii TaxID=28172 RepID=UPI001C306B30|nr:hypothetical protein [Vibrio metschnikovii]
MESAIIGFIGVIVGAFLGEYFRRKNRIEAYSHKVFDRRLKAHEELYSMFVSAKDIIHEVMENRELSDDERQQLVSSVIMPLCQFMDKNGFYLNDYLTVQVATAYMGAEDVLSVENELEQAVEKSKINEKYKATMQMIINESGVAEVNKHFTKISKSSPTSPVIERVKELQKARV